jgi:hypothetical protein
MGRLYCKNPKAHRMKEEEQAEEEKGGCRGIEQAKSNQSISFTAYRKQSTV